MFENPKNAVLVGITKLSFVKDSLGDWDDVYEIAADRTNK